MLISFVLFLKISVFNLGLELSKLETGWFSIVFLQGFVCAEDLIIK